MHILIVEPDFRLRSRLFTALNDAGFWLIQLPLDRPALVLPRMRREPCALVTDVDGAACGPGARIAAALRTRWDRLGVVYTAGPDAAVPPLGANDRLLAKPFDAADLVRCVREVV